MRLNLGEGSGGKMKKSTSLKLLALAATSVLIGALSPYVAAAVPTAKISEVTLNKKTFRSRRENSS
jgi:hypothetical protein